MTWTHAAAGFAGLGLALIVGLVRSKRRRRWRISVSIERDDRGV